MKIKAGMEQQYSYFKENNSKDQYSAEVVRYTDAWAELMEARMDAGEKIESMASSTSQEADTDGITGFMYGCAVGALAEFWQHGEELRVWHNLKTQLGNEGEQANKSGGVLNPALLNISTEE